MENKENKKIRKKKYEPLAPNMEKGEYARYLRHALGTWKLPPIDISDIKQVEERIAWYFNYCVENDTRPLVSGMCSALGISRATFHRWGVGELRQSTHRDPIKKVYEIMEQMYEGWLMDGKINPVVGIFLTKNHFGYTDKQDIAIAPVNPLGDTTDTKELQQRYIDSIATDEIEK